MKTAEALDEWAWLRRDGLGDGAVARELADLADELDPEPLRGRMRAAIVSSDLESLETLSEEIDLETCSVRNLDLLGLILLEGNLVEAGRRLIEEAWWRDPSDSWVNSHLALAWSRSTPPDRTSAVGHARAALAALPDSPSRAALLAHCLQLAGRTEESLRLHLANV